MQETIHNHIADNSTFHQRFMCLCQENWSRATVHYRKPFKLGACRHWIILECVVYLVVRKVGSVTHDQGFRNASLSTIKPDFHRILMSRKSESFIPSKVCLQYKFISHHVFQVRLGFIIQEIV